MLTDLKNIQQKSSTKLIFNIDWQTEIVI